MSSWHESAVYRAALPHRWNPTLLTINKDDKNTNAEIIIIIIIIIIVIIIIIIILFFFIIITVY